MPSAILLALRMETKLNYSCVIKSFMCVVSLNLLFKSGHSYGQVNGFVDQKRDGNLKIINDQSNK